MLLPTEKSIGLANLMQEMFFRNLSLFSHLIGPSSEPGPKRSQQIPMTVSSTSTLPLREVAGLFFFFFVL